MLRPRRWNHQVEGSIGSDIWFYGWPVEGEGPRNRTIEVENLGTGRHIEDYTTRCCTRVDSSEAIDRELAKRNPKSQRPNHCSTSKCRWLSKPTTTTDWVDETGTCTGSPGYASQASGWDRCSQVGLREPTTEYEEPIWVENNRSHWNQGWRKRTYAIRNAS